MTVNPWIGVILFAAALAILADDIIYGLGRLSLFRDSDSSMRPREMPVIRLFFGRQRFQAELTDIRDFLITLQLSASLGQTLSTGLMAAARQFADRGDFGRRLNRHVETRLSISPEEVLRGLATDFNSEEIEDLLTRLEVAREKGGSIAAAVEVTAEDLEDRITAEVRQQIKRTPTTLTIPMVLGVFLPALVLVGYPLIRRVLDGILNII